MKNIFINAQQKPCVTEALKMLIKKLHAEKRPVKQIVEIGTYMGGFTQILKSIKEFKTVPIHTFDINLTKQLNDILLELEIKNVYFYMENIWTNETFNKIKNIISKKGTTLVFCDGGNKIREFNCYANLLKENDFIFAHDYARNYEYGEKINYKPEITDADVEKSCIENNLYSFLPNEFASAIWLCKRKSSKLGIDLSYANKKIWNFDITNKKKMSNTKVIDSCVSFDGQIYGGQSNKLPSIYLSYEQNRIYPDLKYLLSTFGNSKTILAPMTQKKPVYTSNEIELNFIVDEIKNGYFDIRINYFDENNNLVGQELIEKHDCKTEYRSITFGLNEDLIKKSNSYYVLLGLRASSESSFLNGSVSFNYNIINI